MAYAFLKTYCYQCGRLVCCNPNTVPSLTIKGTRQPFCLACVNRANPIRIAAGLAAIVVTPGAYEPCHESELIFGD